METKSAKKKHHDKSLTSGARGGGGCCGDGFDASAPALISACCVCGAAQMDPKPAGEWDGLPPSLPPTLPLQVSRPRACSPPSFSFPLLFFSPGLMLRLTRRFVMNRADLSGGDLGSVWTKKEERFRKRGFFFRSGVELCWNWDSICFPLRVGPAG